MARTKVRRTPVGRMHVVAIPQRTGNKNMLNRRLRNIPFKLKQIITEMERVIVKKMDK